MALTILGLSGAVGHDPSAALYIDGKLVAAAEEERFVRDKHAKNRMPYEAAKFCLEFAGLKPGDVDVVAIPYAPISLSEKARWHYARRYWYAPDRALDALFNGNRRFRRYKQRIEWCLVQLGIDPRRVEIVPVEHHLAHASSCYHLSGFKEKTAILGIDGIPVTGESSGDLPPAHPKIPLQTSAKRGSGRGNRTPIAGTKIRRLAIRRAPKLDLDAGAFTPSLGRAPVPALWSPGAAPTPPPRPRTARPGERVRPPPATHRRPLGRRPLARHRPGPRHPTRRAAG